MADMPDLTLDEVEWLICGLEERLQEGETYTTGKPRVDKMLAFARIARAHLQAREGEVGELLKELEWARTRESDGYTPSEKNRWDSGQWEDRAAAALTAQAAENDRLKRDHAEAIRLKNERIVNLEKRTGSMVRDRKDTKDALNEIANCSRHLRQGGATPEDLAGLEEGLNYAVDIAAGELAKMEKTDV